MVDNLEYTIINSHWVPDSKVLCQSFVTVYLYLLMFIGVYSSLYKLVDKEKLIVELVIIYCSLNLSISF